MRAYYSSRDEICVELNDGEGLGAVQGPIVVAIGIAPGNPEYDALMALVAADEITIEPYVSLDPGFDLGLSIAEIIGV